MGRKKGTLMEILLIRHGESEADILNVHEGRADFPLTEKGIEQATKMASFVSKHFPPDLILSSPLRRAKRTAETLQEKIGCELIEAPELAEYNNGVLAGMDRKEAAIKYPLPKGGRPIHIPIQDGESELEFRYRVEKMYHQIFHDYKGKERIAIVSHGGFISNFICAFLKLPIGAKVSFPTGDTGIHLLEVKGDERIVKFMNRLEHLEG